MLKSVRVWQEETFEIKKVGVVKVVFSFLAFLCFFGRAKTFTLHSHLQPQYKYELFHIYFT